MPSKFELSPKAQSGVVCLVMAAAAMAYSVAFNSGDRDPDEHQLPYVPATPHVPISRIKREPAHIPPNADGEFMNIDFQAATREIESNCGISDAEKSTVPVYVETNSGKVATLLAVYEPEVRTLEALESLDMPKDISARSSNFYAFFNDNRFQLKGWLSSPNSDQSLMDVIDLNIPNDVELPPWNAC